MINICIIGFGQVGRTFTTMLTEFLAEFQGQVHINILDPSIELNGFLLDIQHALYQNPNTLFTYNDYGKLEEADYIIYAPGVFFGIGQSRLSVSAEAINLAKSIFSKISFINDPYIIVISNPVDVLCYHLHIESGLSKNRIVSTGTFLDSYRFGYYFNLEFDTTIPLSKIQLLGEHGTSITLNSKLLCSSEFYIQNQDRIEKCLNQTINTAIEIRKTNASSKYAVSQCAIRILKSLIKKTSLIACMGVITNDSINEYLNISEDIGISLPTTIDNGMINISIPDLTDADYTSLKNSAKIIHNHTHSS